ncbi:MAG: 3'-5' exonuclease, partial [Rhodoglobus sp.]|nr:3'-5' exonuclease [Rhodoglobus sp.]
MSNWGRIGAFDLETTGVDVDTSRIVSACIAILDEDGAVIDRWDWLADPGIEIPEGASRVHGITTERARADGRPAHLVVAEIAQSLRLVLGLGMPVVVYNAPYDLSLLDRECRRYGLEPIVDPAPVIDPLVMDKAVDRYRKGKRTLEVTAELYGVALDDAHDAGSDAIAAGRVALALARAYPDELALPATELHERQREWYREQAESFQAYIRLEGRRGVRRGHGVAGSGDLHPPVVCGHPTDSGTGAEAEPDGSDRGPLRHRDTLTRSARDGPGLGLRDR